MAYATGISLLFPILLYRHAKSLWMALFYFLVPEDLVPGRWQHMAAVERPAAPLSDEQRAIRELEEAIAALEGGRPTVPPGSH